MIKNITIEEKNVLPSLRNQDRKKVKLKTEKLNKLLENNQTNRVI